MLLIISKVLVVFIYAAIGFAANKLKVLPDESSKYFTDFIMKISVPCLIISSMTGQDLDGNIYRNTIIILIVSMAGLVIIMILSSLFADHVFKDLPQRDRNVLAASMTGCNSGFMGFPVARSVFGNTVFYYFVIQNIANNIYLFCLCMIHLHHKEERKAGRKNLREVLEPFTDIATVATVVSVIMLFSGITLPKYALDILTTVGDVTIPLSMIMVGVQLGKSDFRNILRDRHLLITAVMKLIVAPAVILLPVMFLPLDPVVKLASVLCICFPGAVVGVIIAAKENSNVRLMAESVAVSTILSIITLPVWILIVSKLFL